jgi:hypothetical protein
MKALFMLALFCAFGSFSAKGQFLPDAEFYIYLTDVRGNKDSILFSYGGAPYTFLDSGYCASGIGLGSFNDTLELRVLDLFGQNSWKHYCTGWDCDPAGNQYSPPFPNTPKILAVLGCVFLGQSGLLH